MDIGEFQKRMDDALDEVKHLLVQSGYYDNLTLKTLAATGMTRTMCSAGMSSRTHRSCS